MSRLPRSIASAGLAMAAAALAGLALGSCAAPLRLRGGADPLAILEPGLAAYARLEGGLARGLAAKALPAEEAASLAPLLERTRVLALGLGRTAAGGASPASNGRLVEAALLGDYPFRRASLGLAASREWRREGGAYLHEASGLRALVPGPDLALASTGPLEPLLARARDPGSPPIPPRLAPLAEAELLVWIPAPFSFAALGELELGSLPARGLLVAARPAGEGRLEATVALLMEDADSARLYRPAVRLAWYFLAPAILGGEAELPGPGFELEGDLIYARGLTLPESALAGLFRLALPEGLPGPAPR